jgi:cytochrome c oxidase subunit 2
MTAAGPSPERGARIAARSEGGWATLAITIVVLLAVAAAVAGIHQATMPQARVETVDLHTLALSGEFVETNLGTAVEPDGSVTVRALGQRYSFVPQCVLVPAETAITIRATSADVIHGLLIEGTNVNIMLVPGYVSVINARFDEPGEHLMPCHEFCSTGHEGMWGKLQAIEKAAFTNKASGNTRLSCVE